MRVLIVVSLAAAFANSACYSPSLADCQFTCSATDTACPGDQVCTSGVCRDQDATGTCAGAHGDAGTADAGRVPNPACEPAPAGCQIISIVGEDCVAHCTSSVGWSAAMSGCSNDNIVWQLAVFDKGIPAFLPAAENWVGLSRATSTANGVWMWLDTAATVSATDGEWASGSAHDGKTNTNAAVKNGQLYSEAATVPNPFLCTHAGAVQPAVTQ